jgi:hypothetical protein
MTRTNGDLQELWQQLTRVLLVIRDSESHYPRQQYSRTNYSYGNDDQVG